jgi:hypothetical protein
VPPTLRSATRRARLAERPRESPQKSDLILVAARVCSDRRMTPSLSRKLVGRSMLRPVSARFQTALTFMLDVHRPISPRG